jgi:hypothetical protein
MLKIEAIQVIRGKAIPVTCHGGPQDSEMLRLPHFLGNWLLIDAVSPTDWMPFTLQDIPGISFC